MRTSQASADRTIPDYEILFCVGDTSDPVFPVLQQLVRDFPERQIRIVIGSGRSATNDKVAKLTRLVEEASHEYLVISDSDVRVGPDYLRNVIAPLANPKIGATTCFYVPLEESTWVERLQDVGMVSDFYPGILVAKQLDGVKFALGPTIATTRTRLQAFGGYASLENRPADDLLVGRLIAEQGYEVDLLPYTISTVADYRSLNELFHKRLRWITVMRHMRPWGHFGLIFTLGLPWALVAVALLPTPAIVVGLSWWVSNRARRVDHTGWLLGAEADRHMEETGLYTSVGRNGEPDLAGEFYAQDDSVARTGLSDA